MELGYIVFSIVRLGLLLFSFFALPPSILMLKTAWQMNDKKKCVKELCFFGDQYLQDVFL